jgi:hypothetical protein
MYGIMRERNKQRMEDTKRRHRLRKREKMIEEVKKKE